MDNDKWNSCVGTHAVLTHKTARKAMEAGPRNDAPNIPKPSQAIAEPADYIAAQELKEEANKLFRGKDFDGALEKYKAAIAKLESLKTSSSTTLKLICQSNVALVLYNSQKYGQCT